MVAESSKQSTSDAAQHGIHVVYEVCAAATLVFASGAIVVVLLEGSRVFSGGPFGAVIGIVCALAYQFLGSPKLPLRSTVLGKIGAVLFAAVCLAVIIGVILEASQPWMASFFIAYGPTIMLVGNALLFFLLFAGDRCVVRDRSRPAIRASVVVALMITLLINLPVPQPEVQGGIAMSIGLVALSVGWFRRFAKVGTEITRHNDNDGFKPS